MQARALSFIVCFAILAWNQVSAQLEHEPSAISISAQQASTMGQWGDQGDNTFVNPILPGDFSDLDAIRVGRDFYAITSTMQYSPGMAILHSRDLVNWQIVGHVVSDISAMDPELGWQRMNRAGRGIWAGSIRYHAKRFWVYFGTPDGGIYVSTAPHALGPWSTPRLIIAETGWDDPCPFWDEDGRGYLIATRFAPDKDGVEYRIHLFAMNPDGMSVSPSSDRIVHQSRGSEANKMYKIDGTYLHYFSEVRPEGRVAMMERSRSLDGPWEIRQLNHVRPAIDKEPNQGGLIQLMSGQWWFLTHQGTGDWEGRAAVLLPVTWIEGWPILGDPGADKIGEMIWGATKPIASRRSPGPFTGDEFHSHTLEPNWEWRYQPRAQGWSLTGRALRLKAFQSIHGADFSGIGSVLTQRSARSTHVEVTVRMDVSGLKEGQEAGLAHVAETDCRIAVIEKAGLRTVVWINGPKQIYASALRGNIVWLRTSWGVDGLAHFSYSSDGTSFTEVGLPYQMTWGAYRGDRIGLYTVARPSEGGYVDFSSFRYSVKR